jgi:hypothetical protein
VIAEADRRALVADTLVAIVMALAMLTLRTLLGPALAMRPLGPLLARLGVMALLAAMLT